jgi:hypothetical protein
LNPTSSAVQGEVDPPFRRGSFEPPPCLHIGGPLLPSGASVPMFSAHASCIRHGGPSYLSKVWTLLPFSVYHSQPPETSVSSSLLTDPYQNTSKFPGKPFLFLKCPPSENSNSPFLEQDIFIVLPTFSVSTFLFTLHADLT